METQDMQEDDVLAQTETFAVWTTQEEMDTLYHIELGGITLHLNSEEWQEFVVLIKEADQNDS